MKKQYTCSRCDREFELDAERKRPFVRITVVDTAQLRLVEYEALPCGTCLIELENELVRIIKSKDMGEAFMEKQ